MRQRRVPLRRRAALSACGAARLRDQCKLHALGASRTGRARAHRDARFLRRRVGARARRAGRPAPRARQSAVGDERAARCTGLQQRPGQGERSRPPRARCAHGQEQLRRLGVDDGAPPRGARRSRCDHRASLQVGGRTAGRRDHRGARSPRHAGGVVARGRRAPLPCVGVGGALRGADPRHEAKLEAA